MHFGPHLKRISNASQTRRRKGFWKHFWPPSKCALDVFVAMRFRSIRKYVCKCVLNDIQMTRAARATHATASNWRGEEEKIGSREKKKQPEGEKKKKLEAEKRKNNLKGRNRSWSGRVSWPPGRRLYILYVSFFLTSNPNFSLQLWHVLFGLRRPSCPHSTPRMHFKLVSLF